MKNRAVPVVNAQTTCDGCGKVRTASNPPKLWHALELHSPTKSGLFVLFMWQLCSTCARRLKLRGPVLLPTHDRRAKR